tara:strand:+ start:299 stop:1312 length:1014 start_codon:yes stop_codon:yes gene_type:complete
MSEFRVDKITNREGTSGPQICGVSTFSGTSGMAMPSGPTEYRGGRGRMVTFGGYSPDYNSEINYIEIATTGDATDFGDCSRTNGFGSGMASSTRGVLRLGRNPSSHSNHMEYVTFSSNGGVAEFGDDGSLLQDSIAPFADSTRGCLATGTEYSPAIRYITIASTGDSTPFGDLSSARYMGGGAGGASPTRGFAFGGLSPKTPTAPTKIIEYINIQSGGNAVKFGELTVGRRAIAAVTNSTRAVMCSGDTPATDTMDYITMASEGEAVDFGNITRQPDGYGAGGSTATRGVIMGCDTSPKNSIDYITISTTGNATDFGDTTYNSYVGGACSDSHGGLG